MMMMLILDGDMRQVERRDNNKSLVKQCSTRVMAKPHTAQLLYQPRAKRTKLFISSVRCTLLNSIHTHTKHCSMLLSRVQCSMFVIDTRHTALIKYYYYYYCSAMQCNAIAEWSKSLISRSRKLHQGFQPITLLHSTGEISRIMETEMPRSGQQPPPIALPNVTRAKWYKSVYKSETNDTCIWCLSIC